MGSLRAGTRTRRRVALWALGLLLPGLLMGCGSPAAPAMGAETPETILLRAAGSGALQPLLDDLMAVYRARRPGTSLDLLVSNTDLGWEAAAAREADLGLVSWGEVPPGETMQTWRVARDGIAVIVHPSTALTGLSLLQIREVFSGRLWEWRGVAASQAGTVQVISREEGSGTRAAFEALAMEGQRVTPTALMLPSGRSVMEYVAEHPGAIGYVSMGLLSTQVKVLRVEGELPTPQTVGEGRYPLSRDLMLVAANPATSGVRALVEFALSPAGQEIVAQRYGRIR